MLPEISFPGMDEIRPGSEGLRSVDAETLAKAGLLPQVLRVADPAEDETDPEDGKVSEESDAL